MEFLAARCGFYTKVVGHTPATLHCELTAWLCRELAVDFGFAGGTFSETRRRKRCAAELFDFLSAALPARRVSTVIALAASVIVLKD